MLNKDIFDKLNKLNKLNKLEEGKLEYFADEPFTKYGRKLITHITQDKN